jgi:phosphatidate cytidylyltransferase
VGRYLWFTAPVFAIGAVAFWWASRRVAPAIRRARWIKFATYVVIVHLVLAATVVGRNAMVGLTAAVAVLAVEEVLRLISKLTRLVAIGTCGVLAGLAVGAIHFAAVAPPALFAYAYLVVAVFDGFSQASGQIAGRTKLAPAISPGKTVEGLAIGAAITIGCAFLLRSLASLSMRVAAMVGVVSVVAGLGGDLAASWVKRRAGVKDYGSILPGHGGVLDRFDSFLAVAAALSLLTSVLTSGSS